ncbi:MAG: EamA family transporter [Anaerolineaceae bacterium]|jgi:drug/metabolite transporter (DMT)-like permease|nr:MAG: EamA family transporter [Anaerolineaceae bacterium]
MKNPSSNKAYFIALASAVFLSTTAIFIRYLTLNYKLPALVLAFWRDFFVVFTLFPILFFKHRDLLSIKRDQLAYLIIYGLVLAVFNSFWTLSVSLNGASVATVLSYCSAAFTALLGYWLLKEDLGWIKIAAIACSLIGCVLVSGAYNKTAWQSNLVGILSGILAGLSYAAYSLMGRNANQRGMNPWTTILYTFAFAGMFLLVINLIPGINIPGVASQPADLFWLGADWKGWLPLFLLAAGPTVVGFGLYNISMQVLPASVANLIATSEPVFTSIFAFLIFGERLGPVELTGGFLVMTGVILLRISRNGKKVKTQLSRN